jgi:hypothetical protein
VTHPFRFVYGDVVYQVLEHWQVSA